MKRIPLLAVGAIVLVVAVAALWSGRSESDSTTIMPNATTNVQTKVFRVEQMTCATCPIAVKAAMGAVKGVTSVEVDFNAKTATVTFDPAVATTAQIAAASTNAGYPATPAS